MNKQRRPQKAKDRFITTATGHKTYTGAGIHQDRRTKRVRTRAAQERQARKEYGY